MGNFCSLSNGRVAIFAVAWMLTCSALFAGESICEKPGDHDCACASNEVEDLLPRGPDGCRREHLTAARPNDLWDFPECELCCS